MKTMHRERLEEIARRLENATSGPWAYTNSSVVLSVASLPYREIANCREANGRGSDLTIGAMRNAVFIAHAREDMAEMLRYIAHLEAMRDA